MRTTALWPVLVFLAACGGADVVPTPLGCSTNDAGSTEAAIAATSDASSREASNVLPGDSTTAASSEASDDSAIEASTDASGEAEHVDGGADAVASEAAADAASPMDAGSDAAADRVMTESDAPGCNDNRKNGDETDIDCGGSCPACGLGQGCLVNSDCGSWPGCNLKKGGCTCDAISRTCVTDHCSDHQQDVGESAVDCGGGECPGCVTGQTCVLDSDCADSDCDTISFVCASDRCSDHHWDGSETDTDCGGGQCPGCAVGLQCNLGFDCASKACDGILGICVDDQCADHDVDGTETDMDCGGTTCPRCPSYKKCKDSSDCMPGHTCTTTVPHLCSG